MKSIKISLIAATLMLAVSAIVFISSCSKKFDEPPYEVDPNLKATKTLKALKALHGTVSSGGLTYITDSTLIEAVVVANDKSGNIYKELYIEDSTAGIAVELEATGLYNSYPIGRKVYIQCKGMVLSDASGLMKLGVPVSSNGTTTLGGILGSRISKYITGGSYNNPVVPHALTFSQLTTGMQDRYVGTLVKLEGWEFQDIAKTYSDTSYLKNTTNRNIQTCDKSTLIVRSSAYANFAGIKLPSGNGSITAVFTVFGTTRQLLIRDTADVKFTGPRCYFFEENFNAYTVTGTAPLVITGWKNIMETGDVPYTLASFSGSVFPKVSAFTSTALPTTNISTWLISPDINLPAGTTPKYTFTCSRRYTVGTFKAYISTNYTGGTPASATWVLLGSVPANSTDAAAFTPFDTFGPYTLTTYAGQKVNLAFRYEAPAGTNKNSVTTYEVDDIKISRN